MKTDNGHTGKGVERDPQPPPADGACVNGLADPHELLASGVFFAEELLKVLPGAIYVTDADGRITF